MRRGLRKFRRAEIQGRDISAFLSWLPKLKCFSEVVASLFPEYTDNDTVDSSLIRKSRTKKAAGFLILRKYKEFYAVISVSNQLDFVLLCFDVELQELSALMENTVFATVCCQSSHHLLGKREQNLIVALCGGVGFDVTGLLLPVSASVTPKGRNLFCVMLTKFLRSSLYFFFKDTKDKAEILHLFCTQTLKLRVISAFF